MHTFERNVVIHFVWVGCEVVQAAGFFNQSIPHQLPLFSSNHIPSAVFQRHRGVSLHRPQTSTRIHEDKHEASRAAVALLSYLQASASSSKFESNTPATSWPFFAQPKAAGSGHELGTFSLL